MGGNLTTNELRASILSAVESPENLVALTLNRAREIVSLCTFPEYTFKINIDSRNGMYLQASYVEPDTLTGKDAEQLTRRWFISPHMNNSELVQTVFKCVLTSMEHRVREWFRYRDEPVFGPHFDVDALYLVCKGLLFSRRDR